MWNLNESLDLVRTLQPLVKPLGYHLTLGGGVLNLGYSKNDLDIYVLPMNVENGQDNTRLINLLLSFGFSYDSKTSDKYGEELKWEYNRMIYKTKRVEFFVF